MPRPQHSKRNNEGRTESITTRNNTATSTSLNKKADTICGSEHLADSFRNNRRPVGGACAIARETNGTEGIKTEERDATPTGSEALRITQNRIKTTQDRKAISSSSPYVSASLSKKVPRPRSFTLIAISAKSKAKRTPIGT